MPKETLIAIGAGVLGAFAATAFLSRAPGAMMLVYFAELPLFMAGFGLGPQAIAISGAVGFMAAGLIGGGLAAAIFGITQILPAWLVVRQMLLQRPQGSPGGAVDWYPAGDTLCWLTMLAAAALVAATVVSHSGGEGLSALVSTNLENLLQAMAPQWEPDQRARMVEILTPLFPGAIGVSWMIMTVVNATLAQGFLVKWGNPLRPTPAYADLQLPQWISWPMIAAALLALMGSGEMEYTGRNLAMILAVPFFFLGLAVVHTWARRTAYTTMVLVAFYMILVISGWATLIVAGIGIFELWSGLRRLLDGPSNDND
ncbi:MAG: DUF2232 domain-containing protein [Proteobacteria bacterium]|nr:DUF2232 domain-containing protein [Pseudomonadota bacterium]